MHGLIHLEFRNFGIRHLGEAEWKDVVREAGVPLRACLPTKQYADEELFALVLAVARRRDSTVEETLVEFGRCAVKSLLEVYGSFIEPTWRTLDLLQHTERVIHRAVRLNDPAAAPPRLTVTRRSQEEVLVIYTSERRLCAFAKGLIGGIADHYGDEIVVSDETCMHVGDPDCRLVARIA